jgi:hypothetical protein
MMMMMMSQEESSSLRRGSRPGFFGSIISRQLDKAELKYAARYNHLFQFCYCVVLADKNSAWK